MDDDDNPLGDFTVVEPGEQPAIAPRGLSEVLDGGGGVEVVSEVLVGGVPKSLYAKPPSCTHELSYTQQVVVARLTNDAGALVGWRAQLKIRCGECGTQFRFKHVETVSGGEWREFETSDPVPDTALSDDRITLGAMMEPVPEGERPDEWAAVGGVGRITGG